MAQLATILQTTNLVSAEGGLTWSTTVYDGSTGEEVRNQNWTVPRRVWALSYAGYESDIQAIVDLFEEARGMLFSFLFTPPNATQGDYRFTADELRPTYQASASNELIAMVSFGVIEVLDE